VRQTIRVILGFVPLTTFLIDVDETLYASNSGVWDAISQRIEDYMHKRLRMDLTQVPVLRAELFKKYGTTLRGLKQTINIDERDYLEYVHDVPLQQYIQPDPLLAEVLRYYQQRKFLFTNGDRYHAGRVVRSLGLEGCFDGIIDIYDISPHCKPLPEAYKIALSHCGSPAPETCAFIDDNPRNLSAARQLGFYTIHVGNPYPGWELNCHAHITRLHDLPQVIDPKDG
jgi:putative hydrolase of the HAD superfamily